MSGNIRIIYFWIKESMYGCLKNKEFIFSNDYKIHFDFDQLTLSIQNNNDTTNVFDNIISHKFNMSSNLTAIVGDNGVGKSTLLKEINSILNNISKDEYIEKTFIIMFEYESKIEYITNGIKVSVIKSEALKKTITPNDGNLSDNFSYILMDEYLKIDGVDLMDSKSFSEEFADNVFVHYWDFILGVSELKRKNSIFEDSQFELTINENLLYDYMKILFTNFVCKNNIKYEYSLYNDLIFTLKEKKKVMLEDISFNCNNKESNEFFIIYFYECVFKEFILYLKEFIYINLNDKNSRLENKLNYFISDFIKCLSKHKIIAKNNGFNDCDWCYYFASNPRQFNPIIIFYYNKNALLKCLIEICDLLNDEISNYFKEVVQSITQLNSKIYNLNDENRHFTINRCDLIKITTENKYAFYFFKYIDSIRIGMSSGEEKILNLFSQLFFLMNMSKIDKSTKSIEKNLLILIDEIDALLHPEWQRKILYDILNLFNTFYVDHNIQIIFTTHSPIVLSDIPKDNCIFLKKHKNEIEVVDNNILEQTFGQNIYTLYKNAFFLNNSYIGQFSKNYIEKLNEYIDCTSGNTLYNERNECLAMINVIGEPVLKKILINKFNDKVDGYVMKWDYIEFLKDKKLKIEREIEYETRKLSGDVND